MTAQKFHRWGHTCTTRPDRASSSESFFFVLLFAPRHIFHSSVLFKGRSDVRLGKQFSSYKSACLQSRSLSGRTVSSVSTVSSVEGFWQFSGKARDAGFTLESHLSPLNVWVVLNDIQTVLSTAGVSLVSLAVCFSS